MSDREPVDARARMSTIVASVSGGKDSAAMCLYLRELGLECVRVFADTGWEHPDTYTYLRGPLTQKLGPIDEVVGRDGGMENLIRRKGMFPSRRRRFCTEELKLKPIQAYLDTIAGGGHKPVVNAIGIRAAESAKRAHLSEWEWSNEYDCWVWRPIIGWSEQDVIDIHTRHGLVPNPLYLRGAQRVGCWPCIFARKGEIRRIAAESPERIAVIAALEAELPLSPAKLERLVQVTDAEGEFLSEYLEPARPPMKKTFFHGLLTREGIPVPIEKAVAWSQTRHGSRDQLALFHDLGEPEGCVRWGLCEGPKDDDEKHHGKALFGETPGPRSLPVSSGRPAGDLLPGDVPGRP